MQVTYDKQEHLMKPSKSKSQMFFGKHYEMLRNDSVRYIEIKRLLEMMDTGGDIGECTAHALHAMTLILITQERVIIDQMHGLTIERTAVNTTE